MTVVERPVALIVGPAGDALLGIMEQLLNSFGADTRICPSAEDAVDLAIDGGADLVIYSAAPDLTGPEMFDTIRWWRRETGLIYLHPAGDPLKDRIIPERHARTLQIPFTLRRLIATAREVCPAFAPEKAST